MRVLSLMLCLAMVCPLLSLKVRGQEDTAARQLPFWSILKEYSGFAYIPTICDGYETTISVSTGPAKLILEHSDGIGSLYFIFAKEYGSYTVTDNATGQVTTWGEERFLHDDVCVSWG